MIERYDRIQDERGQITRLHQEDFCQELDFGHERKYQEDGGPSFTDCYRLIQDVSSDPANDLQHLLRWQIFNVLAGNSDGHAKNLYTPLARSLRKGNLITVEKPLFSKSSM